MFSLELPDTVTEIGNNALGRCFCLRNVAFPPNIVFGHENFLLGDLYQLFGNSNARIIRELQHRFDRLPIHSLVYYQSYHQGVLQILVAAINMRLGQQRKSQGTTNSKSIVFFSAQNEIFSTDTEL
jgi:hypothetical protein